MSAPSTPTSFTGRVHHTFFRSIHRRHRIDDASRDDPRVDRALFGSNRKREVVVITGGGCTTLDELLDGTAGFHAVDTPIAEVV